MVASRQRVLDGGERRRLGRELGNGVKDKMAARGSLEVRHVLIERRVAELDTT